MTLLKLLLDIEPSSSAKMTENNLRVAGMFSSRIVFFVLFKSKGKPTTLYRDGFLDILTTNKGASGLACFNVFRYFTRSLKKRGMSPSQTITTE